MTRIFVYEHITAHGIGRDPASPEHSLHVEGRAMFDAIRADFAAIAGVEVLTGGPEDFAELAARGDWSFVIAPETDAVLLELADEVIAAGGRLLGPSPAAIALTSDKFALFRHWKSRGVPTPETVCCPAMPNLFPCVVKRRDGAGSEGMRIVEISEAFHGFDEHWIAQPVCEGLAASVSFLVGPNAFLGLSPTFQNISSDRTFRYSGGCLPIAPRLAARAERLARHALEGIPGLLGIVGVDLLLGADGNGRDDLAIEINPRLTTSYVGLRAHLDGNIAEAVLKAALGQSLSLLAIRPGRGAFTAAGICALDPSRNHWNTPSEIPADPTFFLQSLGYSSEIIRDGTGWVGGTS
jgi:predicted ATP-grasp superfamily ATP-dependent carboligase